MKTSARRRRRRWIVWLLLLPALMLLVAGIVVQILLSTDLPHRIVISQLENQLGLRVGAKSVKTGWFGHTTLTDVTLGLPLVEKPFLEVPTVKVRNSTLFSILLGRKVTIYAFDLAKPTLRVIQTRDGRWNIQDLIEIVSKNTTGNSSDNSAPSLPDLHVHAASVFVRDQNGRRTTIEPLDLDGFSDTPLSWKFDARSESRLKISGRLAPGGIWAHDATAQLNDIGEWARPFLPSVPAQTALDARWRGQFRDQNFSGRLDLAALTFGNIQASGNLTASVQSASTAISLGRCPIQTGNSMLRAVTISSGKLSYDGKRLRADRVELAALGGPARFSGFFDRDTEVGELHAAWEKLQSPWQNIQHDGRLDATIRQPFPGQLTLDGNLASTGVTPQGPWTIDSNFAAHGADWRNFDWSASAPQLNWQRSKPINFDGLRLTGNVRPDTAAGNVAALPIVTLASVARPGDQLSGQGSYNFFKHTWLINLQGERWPLHPIEGRELGFDLRATGDSNWLRLQELKLAGGGAHLTATGTYHLRVPKPLSIEVRLANEPAATEPPGQTPFLHGSVSGYAALNGTLLPLELTVNGSLNGRDVRVNGRPLGAIDLITSGTVDPDKVDVHTETLKLLGGNWDLRGTYAFAGAALDLGIAVRDLPLSQLMKADGQSAIGGALDGNWDLYVPGFLPSLTSLKLHGQATASRVSAPFISADSVQITTAMESGTLTFDPIQLSRGEKGEGHGRIVWSALDRQRIEGAIALNSWPILLPAADGRAEVTLKSTQFTARLPQPSSADPSARVIQLNDARIELGAKLWLGDQRLGSSQIVAALNGRSVELSTIHAEMADGKIDGDARANLDQINEARANLKWDKIDTEQVLEFFPSLRGMGGTVKGSAHLAPATDPRALGPLEFVMDTQWSEGFYRTVPLKDLHIDAYLQMEPGTFDPQRIVLADTLRQDSVLHLADGTAHLWARATRHDNHLWTTQGQVRFDSLQLDPVVQAFDAKAATMPGRLSGSITALYDTPVLERDRPSAAIAAGGGLLAAGLQPIASNTTSPTTQTAAQVAFADFIKRLYLDAHVKITNSNLANFSVVSFLYDAMNLGRDVGRPTGRGSIAAQLDGGVLTISHLNYFNRGTEVRSVARIDNIWNFPNSPISGSAVGSARPLSSLKLPLIADVDQIFNLLQSDLTSVVFNSPNLRELSKHMQQVSFRAIGQTMRAIILGDVREGSGAPGQ